MNLRRVQALLGRARRLGLRRALKQMRPIRIDELLYELRPNSTKRSGEGGAHLGEPEIQRFHSARLSPWPSINAQLSPSREVYLVAVGNVVAHQSWIMIDALNPAAFGFDSTVPIIGECTTDPAFRGRNLYPLTLEHIAQDIGQRHGVSFVYVTVNSNNVASIRGIEKAGGRLIAHLRGWRVLARGFPRPARLV